MKTIKFLIKFVLCLVVLLLAIVLTLPLWIGPVVKVTANSAGPKFTKTHVNLGDFGLNYYTGVFHMGDLQVENPAGYSQREAATLGELRVELEPLSVATDVIHIRLIRIKDVFASYVSKDGVNNIDQLMINAGVKSAEENPDAEAPAADKEGQKAAAEESKSEKKVIIDRVEISGVLVQLGPIPLPIPPLTLTDIGKKSGGATLEEAWTQISEAVMKSAGALGDGLKALGGLTGDAAKQAGALIGDAAGQATEAASKVTNVASDGVKAVGDGAKAVGDVVGGGAKAVGDGAGKAVDAVGDGAKAVGDGAKKAVDALKSLW